MNAAQGRSDDLVISNIFPIQNGVCKLENICANFFEFKNPQYKPTWKVSVQNLICSKKFHYHNTNEFICLVSPAIQICNRFNRSDFPQYVVLCSAISENGLLSHTMNLSPAIEYEIKNWNGKAIEFLVTSFDSVKLEHQLIDDFFGALHLKFERICC